MSDQPIPPITDAGVSPDDDTHPRSIAETVVAPKSALLRPNVVLNCGHYTNVGQRRKQNQDSLLTMQAVKINVSDAFPLGLYVVADGMGGQASGEVASGLVVSTLAHHAQADLFKRFVDENLTDAHIIDWLRGAIEAANTAVVSGRAMRENDMGSTVVAAVVLDNIAFLAHVGDSRAYRIDRDGDLERLTLDHSLVEQLVLAGQIPASEARTHKRRNIVYRTMGEKDGVEVDVRKVHLQVGDRLVLCSDGLNSMLEDSQIASIVHNASSPMDAVRNLVDAANIAGGEDNITAVLVEVTAL
jgi:serine/threonine protein phosphatase PrpC